MSETISTIIAPSMTTLDINSLDMTGKTRGIVYNSDQDKHWMWNGVYWRSVDGVINRASDDTELTTFSTTGVTYLNLLQTGLDNSKEYIVEGFYIWNHDGTTQDFWMEVRNFSSLIFPRRHQQEPKDSGGGGGGGTNQGYYTSFTGRVTPTAGQVAIDLFFGTTSAGQESTIFYAEISLKEV